MKNRMIKILFLVVLCLLTNIARAEGANNNADKTIPKGFYYVNQDNYILLDLSSDVSGKFKYLYSDGATSCIIVVVVGKNSKGSSLVALSHISRPQGFDVFFKDVIDKKFSGPVSLYAQGANPPEDDMAQKAELKLLSLISSHTSTDKKWYIASVSLSLGQGNPLKDNRSSFGINLDTLRVSNQPFSLTMKDRDSTGGAMEIYVIFGRKLNNPIWLRNALEPLDEKTLNDMMKFAYSFKDYKNAMNKSSAQLIKEWSTTPDREVSWFADVLKMGSQYLMAHYKAN